MVTALLNYGGGGSGGSLSGKDASGALVTATGASSAIAESMRAARQYDISDFGALYDMKEISDLVVTASSSTVTSSSLAVSDSGKLITIYGVGTNANQTIGNNGTITAIITVTVAGTGTLSITPTYSQPAAYAVIGGSDNSTAIANAISYASINGGIVTISRPTRGTIPLKRNCLVRGTSQQGILVIAPSTMTGHAVYTENFDALTGSGLKFGVDARVPSYCGLENLIIDCGSIWDGRTVGNTSTATGVALYGNCMYMNNVTIINNYGDGLITESAATNVYTLYDVRATEESYFNNIHCRENKGLGWRYRTNDGRLDNILCSCNGAGGFKTEYLQDFYNGACNIGKIHVYFNITGYGIELNSKVTIDSLYLDSDQMAFDTFSSGSQIGNLLILQGCFKGVTAVTFNIGAITIGNVIATVHPNATAGNFVLDLNTQQNITLPNCLIDLTGSSGGVGAINNHGNFNKIHLNVISNTSAGQFGVDQSGAGNDLSVLTTVTPIAVKYTAGDHNRITIGGFLTGGQVGFSGTRDPSDTIIEHTNLANYQQIGYAFQTITTSGFEKNIFGASVRYAARTITAAGAVTIVANTDNIIYLNKTTGAATTINLPAFPATGDQYEVEDIKGDAATNNITLTTTDGTTIEGLANFVLSVNKIRALIRYDGVQWRVSIWYPYSSASIGISGLTGVFTSLNVSGSATFSGAQIGNVRVVTAAGAVTGQTNDYVIVVNKTTGAATAVSLATTTAKQVVIVKDGKGDAATNNITITPVSGTIDGAASFVISVNYGSATFVYNGTQWNVI